MTEKKGQVMKLSGSSWALESSLYELDRAIASVGRRPLHTLQLNDLELDVRATTAVIQLLRHHTACLEKLSLQECTGHVDMVLTVAMTIPLQTCSIAVGGLAPTASSRCLHALGVGLQLTSTLKTLILESGSNAFFTVTVDAMRSLEQGLANNTSLTKFQMKGCRFAEPSAVLALAHGLRGHGNLQEVKLRQCFMANGHSLDDEGLSVLIQALEHNTHLSYLDVSGNKCLDRGISALGTLMDRTRLQTLDISSQKVNRETESMNLANLVGAMGRTNTLQRLDLRFNHLNDLHMAYLAAALTHNTSIRFVGLASNHITNTGLSILASRIPMMKGLTHLVLTNNTFDDGLELAQAMEENCILSKIVMDVRVAHFSTIQYYADWNWAGRRFLMDNAVQLLPALWPFILERLQQLPFKDNGMARYANVMYCLLREGPALFPR
jgi:Ran GTPase-activating protein (RanGAP) involved in mRNA processing and transport